MSVKVYTDAGEHRYSGDDLEIRSDERELVVYDANGMVVAVYAVGQWSYAQVTGE